MAPGGRPVVVYEVRFAHAQRGEASANTNVAHGYVAARYERRFTGCMMRVRITAEFWGAACP